MYKIPLFTKITQYKTPLNAIVIRYKTNLQNFILNKWNTQSESIPLKLSLPISVFVIFCFLSIFWLFHFNVYIDEDSAKWTLSSQTQATAAVLGLLIAAGSFRWLSLAKQGEQLQQNINGYLKRMHKLPELEGMPSHNVNVFEIMFVDYVNYIENNRPDKKTASRILGRLFSLRLFAYYYGPSHVKPKRLLTKGELSTLWKPSRRHAMEIWEYYYTNPSEFYMLMLDTFYAFCATIIMPKQDKMNYEDDNRKASYRHINVVTNALFEDGNRLIAEDLKRKMAFYKPRFYWAFAILGSAIIFGLSALSVINNGSCILCSIFGQYSLQTLVIFPVVLSIFGLYVTLLTLEISFR